MFSLFNIIYKHSPVWLQNIFISSYGYFWKRRRYGKYYRKTIEEFKKRENYSKEDWVNYQEKELKNLLSYCMKYVPYYRNRFKEFGIDENFISSFKLENLKFLPILEKKDVQKFSKDLISEKSNKLFLQYYETGGTSGTPLKIYYSSASHSKIFGATVVRHHLWAGINPLSKHITFGGRSIFKDNLKGPYWRYNIFEKQLYMSAFHLSKKTAIDYIKVINEFKPNYLAGYTSATYYISQYIVDNNINTIGVDKVLSSSDKLTSQMRNIIEKAWKCKVFDGYSSVEGCCQATECEYHRLHISPDFGVIEIINDKGEECKEGEEGEIIATGFLNYDFPLIRYRIGDLSVKTNEECPCGRKMQILKEIIGRQEDYLILKDGRASASFSKAFEGVEGIYEGQVIQEDYDKIKIFLVIGEKYNKEQERIFLENIRKIFGELIVELVFVQEIKRTKRGKLKLVISKIREK